MSRFHNPVGVEFGPGCARSLPDLLDGRSCVVVTTPGMARRGAARRLTAGCDVRAVYARVTPNPSIAAALGAAAELAAARAEVVVGLGGGSALDTAKAVAALRHPGLGAAWLSHHLREGAAFPADFSPAPVVALPTTAGTGSEVTMWATLWDERDGAKHSLSHAALYPEAALVDPELTLGLPRDATVSAGLDALSHALEALWNRHANAVSDALALRAVASVPDALRRVCQRPGELGPRAALQEGSLLAGLAFSNTRTALAHSVSYPLTSTFGLPHGLACSLTLPEVLRLNADAHPERLRPVARALGARTLRGAAERLYELFSDLGVAALLRRHLGGPEDLARLDGRFLHPGRAGNNLVTVTQSRARGLLVDACRRILAPPVRRAVPPRSETPAAGRLR